MSINNTIACALGICFDYVVEKVSSDVKIIRKQCNKKKRQRRQQQITSRISGKNRIENDWPNRMRHVKRQPIFIKLQCHQFHYNISLSHKMSFRQEKNGFCWHTWHFRAELEFALVWCVLAQQAHCRTRECFAYEELLSAMHPPCICFWVLQ